MTENPRPRPSRGVMGYVAELQQFDPVPPYADEPATAGPVLPAAPAPSPPRAVPAPIVSHIRQQSQRRIRFAIIAAAAVVILAGFGLGYAALSGPAGSPRAQAPAAGPTPGPTGGLLPLEPALPGVEPVAERPTDPAATSTSTVAVRATRAAGTAGPLPDAVTLPGPGNPPPAATAAPTEPVMTQPVVAPPLPLTATISYVTDTAEDGLLGYAGTVRIENPGTGDVTGWRVALTVPGGNTVTATGASVAQDGETVTFTPSGEAAVPAGGSVTFSFQVAGLLAALPGGCVIDGNPCS
ncbi:cellulose binding domain-containing protein [Actinoplanes auranticolor]|uniref:CBM2 domain-containing protein n=1 Tax=Actinoplanes auranticolor TaxID=47988 RepID=A0A919VPZ1_9ACTN|nr:cellulose binding domain-containing protein [Actinoplanes auranticolor]GIM71637.1 hypothetical protein Aau02nite_47010 [Actinoplanes auranticolor]